MVFKSGEFNLEKTKKFQFHDLPDFVAAFIEARWRWTFIYCVFIYLFMWLAFSGVWWVILYFHGDLEYDHLPHVRNSTEWTPCVREIYSFTSIFLFSIEVHTTIGYGSRTITLECPSAMLTMCMESILGTVTQSFLVGIVFAKLTRPKNRAQTLIFSKNAVINQRDRNLSLVFRVGNTRKSRIISASVQAYLVRFMTNNPLDDQIKLPLSVDSSENTSFIFPISAFHRIDENSPLFSMSAQDLKKSQLEILVVFEGTIESTGQPVQVKTSYTAQEILWGRRFMQMIHYSNKKDGFVIDFQKFDEVKKIETPLFSARQLRAMYTVSQ